MFWFQHCFPQYKGKVKYVFDIENMCHIKVPSILQQYV
jgi:hypothetical protein